MSQIILLISISLYIFVNYIAIKNKSMWSWLCIIIWAFMSFVTFVIILNITRDFQSLVKDDNIIVYMVLSTFVVVTNIAYSLYYFFKKPKF
jgi:carbon starvation protein CstA